MKKTVFITGASRGIGRAVAEKFLASPEYQVVGLSRTGGDEGFPIFAADVGNPAEVEVSVKALIEQFGSIDILICCAGAGLGGALEDFSYEQLAFELNLNAVGTANVIKAALPYMRKKGSGKIVAIGSVAGHVSIPFQAMYSASKAALHAITDALRLELSGSGVQVCIVEPGDTKTDFTARRQYAAGMAKNPDYQQACESSLNQMMYDEIHGKPPSSVANAVYQVCQKRKMPAYRVVGLGYKALCFLVRVLPRRLVECILKKLYLESKKDGGFSYPSSSSK